MATTSKRKSPAKRKPAAAKSSGSVVPGWALSGWIVAGGLGAAWAGPQLGLWSNDVLERIPSIDTLRTKVASLSDVVKHRGDDQTEPPRSPTVSSIIRAEEPARKPVLPPVKPETVAAIAHKPETKPAVILPKPQARAAMPHLAPPPIPPAPVPLMTAGIRKEAPARSPTARPGELAIRRYPFTTAPAIAYVGDLRTLRIVDGEGDWKKVEVSATGAKGWLRLQRLPPEPASQTNSAKRTDIPKPAASLLREADATGRN